MVVHDLRNKKRFVYKYLPEMPYASAFNIVHFQWFVDTQIKLVARPFSTLVRIIVSGFLLEPMLCLNA